MYLQEIPEGVFSTTLVKIQYDCTGDFERCGKEWTLKYKDAQANFVKNGGKHICRQCGLKNNNPASRPEVREKMKQTCLEKYGTTCPLNTAENTATRVEKMFGDPENTKKIVDKRKITSKERYGMEHIMKTEEGMNRLKKSMQEKYGVDFPLQAQECKDKMKETCQERYGVDNPCQLPEVRIKMAQSTLKKYGVEYYNQLPEMKDYLRKNCPQWLKESWENGGPNKGVPRPEEWNQKQRETVTELMMLGIWKSGYPMSKKGFCYPKKCEKNKVYFRSSYEAIYCYWLDNNPDVDWFSFEAFRISYEFEGKTRFYVPDFVIKWNNGKISIKELKAEFLKDDEKQKAKRDAGIIFANSNDMDYELLFNDFFDSLNITFDYLKEINFIN